MENGKDDLHSKLFEVRAQMCDIIRQISTKEASYHKQICDFEKGLSSDFLDMQVRIADKLAKDVVEGVRTPDWVKNMLAGVPEQLSRAEYEILEEILKEKNRFMEEKKTKKMTKAEAFEWLKCKKVYVAGKSGEIQEVLFKAGFSWGSSASQKIESTDNPFLYMDNEGSIMYGGNMELFIRDSNKEISAEDILSIEIVEEDNKNNPKMFSDYVAIIQSQLVDDEVVVITKKNFMTMVK